jgi:glucose/arabinose dehydrogenase
MPTTTVYRFHLLAVTAVTAVALVTGGCGSDPTVVRVDTVAPEVVSASVTVIVEGMDTQGGFAFLPDGTALVTELTGRILSIGTDGRMKEVAVVPAVPFGGANGLLSIAVSPNYAVDRWIFVYYTTLHDIRVGRLRLGQATQPILTGIPRALYSNFGTIAFGPDGLLHVGTGAVPDGSMRHDDPLSLNGRILRITPDGKPAPGNPFPGSPVYSYGHADVVGLAWDERGQLYASDSGELNRILAGRNHGWPDVPGGSHDPSLVGPIVTWKAGGIAILHDKVYAVGARRLLRVDLDGKHPAEIPLAGYGPLRAMATAPDGALLVAAADWFKHPPDGRILRVTVS